MSQAPEQPIDQQRRVLTTQSMLAIEVAAQAMKQRSAEPQAGDLQLSASKLRAHYARERGLPPPEVTLDLLRKRHAERQKSREQSV